MPSLFSSTHLALCSLLLLACKAAPKPTEVDRIAVVTSRQQTHMATHVTITVAEPESPKVLDAIVAAFAEITRLEVMLSEWRDNSQISQVNAKAGGAAVRVDHELFGVLQTALEVSRASAGAFDVTVGALWGAWDFRWQQARIPTPQALAERVALIDHRRLELDAKAQTARLVSSGMKIGLGAIAKGYAVDGASRVLKRKGYPNHLVVAGGDLFASGSKGGRKWRVGVRDPQRKGMYATLEVENEGVATSGNYERFFVKDGVRYHHILDPKTGKPARGLSSATVLAPNATLADAYSTAVFVAGKEKGLRLARQNKLEALVIDEAHVVSETVGIRGRLVVLE